MMKRVHSKRERRNGRRSSRRTVELRDRDHWILESLAKMRFLTTSQIARLHFGGSRSITNRRLRLLRRAGYVRSFSRGLTTDLVFGLLPAGRDALAETAQLGVVPTCPRRLDGQIDHLLAINTVRIVLATTLIRGSLNDWQSDWEIRRYASTDTVPDARFKIEWSKIGKPSFALEVEYNTRSPRKFLIKMLRYATVQAGSVLSTTGDETVLVVSRHPVWMERYRRAIAALSTQRAIWFTTLSELESEGAEGAIWRPSWSDEQTSLGALATCPHGDSTWQPENAAATGVTGVDSAHTCPFGATDLMPDDSDAVEVR